MMRSQTFNQHLSALLQSGQKGVVASVISVQGSAYRREGAKMVIDSDANHYGLISGGCLEADVAEEGKMVMNTGRPFLKRYVLDEDLVWGLGLGCPGTVEILLEPIESGEEIWQDWLRFQQVSEAVVMCKVLPDHELLWKPLFVTDTDVKGAWFDKKLELQAVAIAREKLKQKTPQSQTITLKVPSTEEQTRIFFDVSFPPPRLCIFGAGHDAIPVARFGSELGFETFVIDRRTAFNTEERFPHVKRLIDLSCEEEIQSLLHSHTYIVIMNHHMERDMEALAISLRSEAPYVGVLGPRKRREKMLSRLKDRGITFSHAQLEKIHSPIGLDIGSETSEEIALSILAEMTAFRKGHHGKSLKNSFSIHHHPVLEEQA